ncbi:hypothetical protein J14TS5_02240 [Paenibacillus lautus]|uniref:YwqG family protein n=1 Tax=Paenibacillus lautus TaxID=1401 RepID=UPI001B008850|nr:YwqG family protein [Paenibacillus lautus]GIO95138.1 hypothetical protein J14TS5_02240 [Paenibacillus lautus]
MIKNKDTKEELKSLFVSQDITEQIEINITGMKQVEVEVKGNAVVYPTSHYKYYDRIGKEPCWLWLMGHPDQIQGGMQVGCEIAYGLHSRYDMNNLEVRKQIVNSALKWRLLLQIDSKEDKTGMMWGDVGRIYYWIHEDDLAKLCFDRIICEMQCS